MIANRKKCCRWGVGMLLVGFCMQAAAGQAQEKKAAVPSLGWVPADAATYSVSLRNREQLEAVLKSKTWAKLMSIPVVQMGRAFVEAEWAKPNGNLAPLRAWYEQPGNAEILRFFGELFEEEVFTYGGKNSGDLLVLAQQLQAASQMAQFSQLMKAGQFGGNGPDNPFKFILQSLNDNADRLAIPDQVMGFKFSRTKPAQVAKWLESLENWAGQKVPPLKERFKKVQIHGADVYTLTLDGGMVPWDKIPLHRIEEQPGQYDKLWKQLKETKLTIAVTVRGNYLLLGLGKDTAGLKAVGVGLPNRLSERPEFAPLTKFADRKLTAVSYTSKEFTTALAKGYDVESTTTWLMGLIKDAGLPEEKLAKVNKDLKTLTTELKRRMPQPGAHMSFSFLTARGSEDYTYDWTKNNGIDGSKPLTLLQHVGAEPIGFVVGRERGSIEDYELGVKMIRLAFDNFEDLVLPQLPGAVQQPYQDFMKEAKPLFARLHNTTGKLLLPALDGQSGVILDGKLKSKQWHPLMPAADKDLPIPELALIMGVQDAAKLRQAFKEYREIYNEFVTLIARMVPGDFPDIKLPEPKTKKIQEGTLYFYPLPEEVHLDARITPTCGLSDRVVVFTMSQEHAARLLKATPWKDKAGPLSGPARPLAGAAYFDWAGFVNMVNPWVHYALTQANLGNDFRDHNIREQVQTFMEILQVLRSYSSITYIENGVTVTHGETIIRE